MRSLGWAIATCLIVSVPWYVHNAHAAAQFARFSASYNLLAEGQSQIVPVWNRLVRIIAELPGWPLVVTLGVAGFAISFRQFKPTLETPQSNGICLSSEAARFQVLVTASTLVAVSTLMFPAYFDTRFLLPFWPSIAVSLSGVLAQGLRGLSFATRVGIGAAFAASLAASAIGTVGEPVSTTCWAARGLIDEIVGRYGVATLANVGNTPDWNVCKTGLINELRENPNDCYVLHDLSAESAEGLRMRLRRFDAVVVLENAVIPLNFLAAAPGLNRAYPSIWSTIEADPALVRLADMPLRGSSAPNHLRSTP